jgi:hypothetical protein
MTSPLPQLPDRAHDSVTRCLCHAVHLHTGLRQYVLGTVVESRHRARCPGFGVDLIAVARHAASADQRCRFRKTSFLVLRLAIVVGAAVAGFLGSAAAAALIALAGLMTAWGILFWSIREERAIARATIDDPRLPGELAPALPRDLEDQLENVGQANVIVYAKGQGDPFIGSGIRLDRFALTPIDVTRARRESSGDIATCTPLPPSNSTSTCPSRFPLWGSRACAP